MAINQLIFYLILCPNFNRVVISSTLPSRRCCLWPWPSPQEADSSQSMLLSSFTILQFTCEILIAVALREKKVDTKHCHRGGEETLVKGVKICGYQWSCLYSWSFNAKHGLDRRLEGRCWDMKTPCQKRRNIRRLWTTQGSCSLQTGKAKCLVEETISSLQTSDWFLPHNLCIWPPVSPSISPSSRGQHQPWSGEIQPANIVQLSSVWGHWCAGTSLSVSLVPLYYPQSTILFKGMRKSWGPSPGTPPETFPWLTLATSSWCWRLPWPCPGTTRGTCPCMTVWGSTSWGSLGPWDC